MPPFEYTTLTDEAKQSLITRRIQELEQQHFDHGVTATLLDAETSPEAKAMAAESRRTQAVLERGIAEAVKLRKPTPPPTRPDHPPSP